MNLDWMAIREGLDVTIARVGRPGSLCGVRGTQPHGLV
jgi:hypothetical protein